MIERTAYTHIPSSVKILLLNTGYFSGLDGSLKNYVIHGVRYLHTPERIMSAVEHSVSRLVNLERPDVCCFLELPKKSSIAQDLSEYPFHDISNKYGLNSLLRRLPLFRRNCNGFFAREKLQYKKRYFAKGRKKLIYELDLPNGTTVLLCHFSLSKKTRMKQFDQLKKLIASKKNVILCGDFNIFKGSNEVKSLMEECKLQSVSAFQPTFPAFKPKKAFDLFLCTTDINVTRCEPIAKFHGSDHLPVVLEFHTTVSRQR